MTQPQVTIIIPTFRRPKKLKKAIESVLAQTYPHWQVCVYDNASGDETSKVVGEFNDARIKYYCHPEGIRAPENFQYGLQRVETPFFSFLADDDLLLPEFLETGLSGLSKYPEAAFAVGTVLDFTDKGRLVGVSTPSREKEFWPPPEGLFEMIQNCINWTGIVFRRKVMEIGGIDTSVKPIDVDFTLRAAARFPYVVSQKPCAIFIQHGDSYATSSGMKLIYPSWLKITENINREIVCLDTKNRSDLLMKLKMSDLLSYIATRALLRKQVEEIIPITDLLSSQARVKLLRTIGIIGQKNRILFHAIHFLMSLAYRLHGFRKLFFKRRQYKNYVKYVNLSMEQK